jgi:Fur family ferric uptake transcriptional regulator
MLQKQDKLADWQRRFRQVGHRMTAGRKAILGVLAESPKHLSAEDIYIKIHFTNPAVGLSTVYRTLELLVQKSMVSKFDFGDGRARFELLEGPRGPNHHHHLVCTGCSSIVDYSDFFKEELSFHQRIERKLGKKYNFKITNHLVQYYGVCEACGQGGKMSSFKKGNGKGNGKRQSS